MGVSSTILYGNCIEKNQPVSGTGHHKVVLKGKYKGQKSSFTLDEDILSKHMMLVGVQGVVNLRCFIICLSRLDKTFPLRTCLLYSIQRETFIRGFVNLRIML